MAKKKMTKKIKSKALPQYANGKGADFFKENKEGIVGGARLAAGLALTIGSAGALAPVGVGLMASGGAGLAGELMDGNSQDGVTQPGVAPQAGSRNIPTFKRGGRLRRMPNGGMMPIDANAELQKGEPFRTPGGKIQSISKSAPTHAQGGVKMNLPPGTTVLGEDTNPTTGNKFQDDGLKQEKIQKDANKLLKTNFNKRARNSAELNIANAKQAYEEMVGMQEASKMKKGGIVKAKNGLDGTELLNEDPIETESWMNQPFHQEFKANQYVPSFDELTASISNDTITPQAVKSPTVTYNNPGVSGMDKMNGFMGEYGSAAASMLPTAFNIARGLSKPERETLPGYYNQGLTSLNNRRFNVNPILNANRSAQQIADQNAKYYGSGATRSNRLGNLATRMRGDANAYAQASNVNNQYAGEYAQGLFNVGAQQRNVDVANLQNEAARRNMIGTGLSQMSQYGQNREYMNNLQDSDLQRLQILAKAFPYYSQQFGDLNFS